MFPVVGAGDRTLEIDAALFSVLLDAESMRDGAARILESLAPWLDDAPAALGVRGPDGVRLHVLAEIGEPHDWPADLDERASDARVLVDDATGSLLVPLRAEGRVVGALLVAQAPRMAALLQGDVADSGFASIGAALHALVARNDAELRRRATARRSADGTLAAMAHQITNDLTGALAIAQILQEDLRDEYARDAVGEIAGEIQRAFHVVRDLLDVQLDTHAQDGVVDLNALMERLLRLRGYAIRELGIALDWQPSDAYCPVHVDVAKLELAVLETLRSAELRAHGRVNRAISVSVRDRRDGRVEIRVGDSGTGEMPDLSPRYFDVRWRATAAAALAADGPDLGLVDSLLRACGGCLEAHASKTEGTTLTLVLPRAALAPASWR